MKKIKESDTLQGLLAIALIVILVVVSGLIDANRKDEVQDFNGTYMIEADGWSSTMPVNDGYLILNLAETPYHITHYSNGQAETETIDAEIAKSNKLTITTISGDKETLRYKGGDKYTLTEKGKELTLRQITEAEMIPAE